MLDKQKLVLKESPKHPGWRRWQKPEEVDVNDTDAKAKFLEEYEKIIRDIWHNLAQPVDKSPLMDYKSPRKLVENLLPDSDRDAFFQKSKVYFADYDDEFWEWRDKRQELFNISSPRSGLVIPVVENHEGDLHWDGNNVIIMNPRGLDSIKSVADQHRTFKDTLRIYQYAYEIKDNDTWLDMSLAHELAHSYNFASHNPWIGDRLKRTIRKSGDFRQYLSHDIIAGNPRLKYMKHTISEIPSILTEMAIYSPHMMGQLDYAIQQSDASGDIPSEWLKNFWGFDARKVVHE